MTILRPNATPLIRHAAPYEDYVRPGDDDLLNDAIDTLYGVGDLKLVENAMIDRFAKVLVKETNADTGVTTTSLLSGSISVKTDFATKAAIQAGQFEISRLKWFERVASATATLFSEPGLRYEYDDDKTAQDIAEIRSEGGANLSAQRWDSMACAVQSSALYLRVNGGELRETEVRPTSLWIVFADMITDGDTDRPTNKMNIDEASVVVMALSGSEKYSAWFGPSTEYPNGRHCTYESKKWNDIPLPGVSKAAREYTIDGGYKTTGFGLDQIANPLSLWAMKSKDPSVPVYPFTILYGDPQSTGLMPTSTSMYETGLEFDLTGSMILGASGKGARGMRILTSVQGGGSDIPSNTDEGLVALGPGQDLKQAGWPASNAKSSWEVLSGIARQTAEVNHVPGNIALAQSYPQRTATEIIFNNEDRLDFRRKRIDFNRHSVRRRWEIEKALVNATLGKPVIKPDAVETWNPGKVEFAMDPAQKAAEWTARIELGEASIIDVIRDLRGFTSDNDTFQWMAERKELLEDEKNKEVLDFFKPAPVAAPAPMGGGGLFGGRK